MRVLVSRSLLLLSIFYIYTGGIISANAQNAIGKSAFNDVFQRLDKEKGPPVVVSKKTSSDDIIYISSQEDFLKITQSIRNKVNRGAKNISVVFSKGRYEYQNNHIYLTGNQYKNVSIRFYGNGSEIVSAGESFTWDSSNNEYFNNKYEYIDELGNDFDIWSDVYQADKLIEVVNAKEKLCRIHCDDLILPSNKECQNVEILLTMWYRSDIYKVKSIENGYVYFIANDLSKYNGDYNVNQDFLIGKVLPRFKLCNIYDSPPKAKLYECQKSRLFFLSNLSISSFEISDFVFCGGSSDNSLIHLRDVKASSILIHDNFFKNLKGKAIGIANTSDVQVYDNVFNSNYTYCITSSNLSKNTVIVRNSFLNNGLGFNNTFCIVCRGENYYIANNEMCDFGYGGIGVGVWYKDKDSSLPSYGIVENNHLWYTDDYKKKKLSHSLIDSGAIYTWTINQSSTIRYNFIHDYNGMGSNRGIYCDDGSKNVKIYGNIVLDIDNGNTIDFRVSSSLTKVNKSDKTNNTGNVMIYNIIGGRYKFEGRKGSNQCYKGQNVLIINSKTPAIQNIITNISSKEPDYTLSGLEEKNGKLMASGEAIAALKRLPCFDHIKDFIIAQ